MVARGGGEAAERQAEEGKKQRGNDGRVRERGVERWGRKGKPQGWMVEFRRIQWVGGKAKVNRKGRRVEGVGLSLARHGEGGQGGPDNMGKGRDGGMLEG